MALTPTQQTTLRTHIENTPTLNAFPDNEDGAAAIAAILNIQATPDFTVWRTLVSTQEIMNAINGVSLAALQSAESNVIISVIAAFQNTGLNTSVPDKRQLFDDIFVGSANNNATTRANLLATWKRLALEIERIFATGTGSDADPATLDFEGRISRQDVFAARRS